VQEQFLANSYGMNLHIKDTRTNLTNDEILQHHLSVLNTFNIPKNLRSLWIILSFWILKLHKNPYKQKYIAGSSECSTKPLSLLFTKLLTAIKESLLRYCFTAYSRSSVNQMCILKNSKELFENLKSHDFSKDDNIKMYDFSTLYTTIPNNKLKSRLFFRLSFLKQKWHPEIQISSDWETRCIFCETLLL
jgi:hypothetical protein